MLRAPSAGALLVAMALAACGQASTTGTGPGHTEPDRVTTPVSNQPATTDTTVVRTSTTVGTWPTPPAWPDPDPRTTSPPSTTLPLGGDLGPGDTGDQVARLQTAMAEAGFFRAEIDGIYGERTAAAVVAVHKALDLPRSSSWSAGDWDRLATFAGPVVPERSGEPDRIEIDLTRQLLYRIEGGQPIDVIPVSSGNGEYYENASGRLVRARTPRGDFSLYKQYDGWRISYLGGLYRPWYFLGGYAIHGSDSVPPEPASHGCVRVPNWEADYLAGVLSLGLAVHVWD